MCTNETYRFRRPKYVRFNVMYIQNSGVKKRTASPISMIFKYLTLKNFFLPRATVARSQFPKFVESDELGSIDT